MARVTRAVTFQEYLAWSVFVAVSRMPAFPEFWLSGLIITYANLVAAGLSGKPYRITRQ